MDASLSRRRADARHRAGRDGVGQAACGPVLGSRHGGKAAARVVGCCRLRCRRAGRRRGSCLGRGGLSLGRLLLAVVPVIHGKAALPAAGGGKGIAHRTVDRVEDIALPGKTDLGLGGVDVDVHQLGGQCEHEDTAGELALHESSLVGVFHGGHHGTVFDVAAVDIEILRPAGGTAGPGRRDQAGHPIDPQLSLHRQQVPGKVPAHRGVHRADQLAVAGGDELQLALPLEPEGDLRVGEGGMQHHVGHKGALAGILFEELHPGGSVVEQVPHRDGGAHRAGAGLHALLLPACNAVEAGVLVGLGAGEDLHPGHAGDGGQRLPPEAQGVDAVQILRRLDLAGGMADESLVDVLGLDAGAVVHDLQQLNAAAADGQRDLGRACVDGVFQQFFRHRGGAFHHLARGDQFGCVLVQHADLCHKSPSLLHWEKGRAVFPVSQRTQRPVSVQDTGHYFASAFFSS